MYNNQLLTNNQILNIYHFLPDNDFIASLTINKEIYKLLIIYKYKRIYIQNIIKISLINRCFSNINIGENEIYYCKSDRPIDRSSSFCHFCNLVSYKKKRTKPKKNNK